MIFLLLFVLRLHSQDTVNIYVALWDSPPKSDLYWGMRYGIKTYFSEDENWEIVNKSNPNKTIQEEILFYNNDLKLYAKAKAYHTDSIKRTIIDFIEHAYIAENNELLIYVGHDGLMDFTIDVDPSTNKCDVMVFSCASESHFSPYMDMILSTYTLMAPEAYGVMAAIESWARKDVEEDIRKKTAAAYAKYQKIAISQAERTFLMYSN